MKPALTPADSARFTAGACQYAAEAFAESPFAAQRSFAPDLNTWAAHARARADALEIPEQQDLFGRAG